MNKGISKRESLDVIVVGIVLIVNLVVSASFANVRYFNGWVYTEPWAQFWTHTYAIIVPITSFVGLMFHTIGITNRRFKQ